MAERLIAPQILRGIAALMVATGHWATVFVPGAGYSHTGFEAAAPAVVPAFSTFMAGLWQALSWTWLFGFNFGSGGVLIFFLISGFVIPMSAEKLSLPAFAARRFFRIFPTLWTMFAIVIALHFVAIALGHAHHLPQPPGVIARNALLIPGAADLDPVMWTLSVEIAFYVLAAALVVLAGRFSIMSVACAGFFTAAVANVLTVLDRLASVQVAAVFITYMLIGSALYLWYSGRVRLRYALALSAVLFVAFAFVAQPNEIQRSFIDDSVRALIIFLGAILLEKHAAQLPRIGAPRVVGRFFVWLGDISYPLYLLHGVTGVTILVLLMEGTGNIDVAMFVAAQAVIALCIVVHRFIEAPSQRFGARVGRALEARLSPKTRASA